jgi:phosphomannomutase
LKLHKLESVVVGHDHRHQSLQFAQLTAAVFLSKGVTVHYFPNLIHTPLVPFAVSHFKASAGIMITASHNPKDDNGDDWINNKATKSMDEMLVKLSHLPMNTFQKQLKKTKFHGLGIII